MKIGYARATRSHPDIDVQISALKEAGCHHVFKEPVPETKRELPGLDTALGYVQAGDTLVVWRFDCLALSLSHLLGIVDRLKQKNANLQAVHEAIDTTSSDGTLIFRVFTALQNFDRDIIRERTQAGLAAARARGRKGGRPKGLSEKAKRTAALAEQLYLAGELSIRQMCDELSISRNTFYRYLRHQGVEIESPRSKIASSETFPQDANLDA